MGLVFCLFCFSSFADFALLTLIGSRHLELTVHHMLGQWTRLSGDERFGINAYAQCHIFSPCGVGMKTHPFGVITRFMTAYGDAMNHSEHFRIQDRGKSVKCDVISLASITKIKMMAAHCLKMASFWPVLRSSFSKTIHLWAKRIAQP